MWENRNSKLFGQNNRKKNKKLRMQRTRGEIKLSGGLGSGPPVLIPVRLVLTDLRPGGIDVFSAVDIEIGKEIALTIHGPKRFYSRGTIIARQEIKNETRIIREQAFNFRLGVKFLFDSKEEEEEVKQYAKDILGGNTFVGTKPEGNAHLAEGEGGESEPAAAKEGDAPPAEGEEKPAEAAEGSEDAEKKDEAA